MAPNLSPRGRSIRPSPTMALNARAGARRAEGKRVVNLTAGEPDFDPPEPVLEAIRKGVADGFHKYTPAAGLPETREAVSAQLARDYGLAIPPDGVLVTGGAKPALFNAFQVLCGPGDEVLVPAPYWVSYPDLVELAGATPVVVPPGEDGRIDPARIAAACTERTRVLVVNTPNNPAGIVFTDAEMEALAGTVAARDLWVVSDEIYDRYVFGGRRHVPFATLPGMAERTVTVGGISKSHAMTGWRLGYAAGPKETIRAATSIQSQSFSCANAVAQKAAVAALAMPESYYEELRAAFDRRRRLVWRGLDAVDGLACPEPEGAFYVFPAVEGLPGRTIAGRPAADDTEVAEALLEAGVAVVPGTPFGAPGRIRLSYAASDASLEEAVDLVARAFGGAVRPNVA